MQMYGPKEQTESKPEASPISGIPQQALFTVKETANLFKVHVRIVERWIEAKMSLRNCPSRWEIIKGSLPGNIENFFQNTT